MRPARFPPPPAHLKPSGDRHPIRKHALAAIIACVPLNAGAATFILFDGAAEATVSDRNGVTVWKTDGGRDNSFISNFDLRRAGAAGELPLSEFIAAPTALASANAVTLSSSDDTLAATLETRLTGGALQSLLLLTTEAGHAH